ncbi:unnamed protein product [Zymoseptoria tritici ST99CH_3D7]|uniref:Uncharacterized protein n=1 Tax=Zymoseptoria tritici (strain ST99CH_3D7) TaxID=1276538 RepID=A0A1X7RHS3_ZYMT9|nr:unnamed protein product [Zymoseptoria tritici ST99CH_3D7]
MHQLHALRTFDVGGGHAPHHQKPLPDPPSPTLTNSSAFNPDYILPTLAEEESSSPPTPIFVRRPPSPTYLWNGTREELAEERPIDGNENGRLRKMILRGTGSNNSLKANDKGLGYRKTSSNSLRKSSSLMGSSPVLRDVGNLAPEQSDFLQLPKRSSSQGSTSSNMSGMSSFLARYKTDDSDEETIDGGESPYLDDFSENEEAFARKEQRARDEYHSAVLSTRAEQILANAKARLNVMEGNLRGARDLVAPLTAANLKRATSLGSAHYSPNYSSRARYIPQSNDHDYFNAEPTPRRRLHPQMSSPHIGRDYQGHTRGFSETVVPSPALDSLATFSNDRAKRTNGGHATPRDRSTLRTPEPTPAQQLRTSKSFDYLGGGGGWRDRPLHSRTSPDSNPLEPLPEGDESRKSGHGRHDSQDTLNGLGIRSTSRSSSRALELRDQLSSLKSKMSSLKEKAREDSLKRQSQANQRSSPFSNARSSPPEMFYTSSPTFGDSGLDANAGVGSAAASPPTPFSDRGSWQFGVAFAGHRDAIAEQAIQHARVVEIVAGNSPIGRKLSVRRLRETPTPPPKSRAPTPSGSTSGSSARNRFGYHHAKSSKGSGGSGGLPETTSVDSTRGGSSPLTVVSDRQVTPPRKPQVDKSVDDDYAPSEGGESIYEDAQVSQPHSVPHEQREDAFDYEHFFLTSALANYHAGARRGSTSSGSGSSVSSVATARGPAMNDEDTFDATYPPPTPQTPERLRAIERGLFSYSRRASNDSMSTMNTFATADEDIYDRAPVSPISESGGRMSNRASRSVSPMITNPSRASRYSSRSYYTATPTLEPRKSVSQQQLRFSSQHQWMGSPPRQHLPRPQSQSQEIRPTTAVRHSVRRLSTSDRADSGFGNHKSPPNITPPTSNPTSAKSSPTTLSPAPTASTVVPTTRHSPTAPTNTFNSATPTGDPAARAVAALMDPSGRQLGLRDTAVLFGVVESLRKVVQTLQENEEGAYEGKEMRRRLDGARGWLDGRRE